LARPLPLTSPCGSIVPLLEYASCEGLMRPYRRFPICCPVTYYVGPFPKLPLEYW